MTSDNPTRVHLIANTLATAAVAARATGARTAYSCISAAVDVLTGTPGTAANGLVVADAVDAYRTVAASHPNRTVAENLAHAGRLVANGSIAVPTA
jgi:hypothetical protein